PHVQDDEVRVEGDHAYVLGECLDADSVEFADNDSALLAAREAAGVEIRERAPTRIGARMGRPEKSEKREMNPAVHCLFPIGDAGGSQRDIDEAASHAETMRDTVGEIEVSAGGRRCPSCGNETYEAVCDCGERTEAVPRCPSCGIEVDEGVEECPRCGGGTTTVRRFDVRIDERYRDALDNVGERPSYDILKCVKGLMSERETPEPLEKGVLRAKHDVSTFKDGTVRYDMTDLPLTAFRPDEVGISVDRLREMGYEHDADGEPLTDGEQVVELKPQDVVLSRDSAEHLKRVADFVDDLLTEYYGVEPYHELDGTDDIVGELVMGLAPHTSAGVLGRVVGFTDASVGYAHPFFHAAKRRNCFAPDTKMPFIDEEGSLRHKTVESFVEKRLENTDEDGIRRDDFGTVVAGAEEVEVPSLDEDGEMKLKPVEAVSRHPAPEHLVKITTRDGRDIVVTPDHEMQIPDGSGGVTAERASEICRGDELLTPRHLDTVPDGGVSTVLSNGFERETDSDVEVDMVNSVEYVQSDTDYVYCLTVADTGSLVVNDLASKQCDGDEDCVTLMSDALVNFSREYLPDQRGGQMDAPLVMTSRIDPTEIDDEAHNVDKVSRYPLSFYEAAREYAHPKEVDVDIADDDLGTDAAFDGFGTTVETTRIDAGPENSAYKILPSMDEKTTAQLEIGRKTRAVDESDVAERVVESHFLPDLIGNLRAFTQQEFRCLDCNSKFRRPPLSGDCDCGGEVTLTVHKGSVKKYLDVALETGEKYGVSDYTMQRLEQLRRQIDSLFEDDKSTQSGIADFM
ncbi:MAG: DNA polymerase II large subunit, partial [Methanobacteriota archaeon]